MAAATTGPLARTDLALELRDLDITLVSGPEPVPLVSAVSLSVRPREVLGLVGESGSGKSLTCLAVTGLLERRAVRATRGSVRLFGRELLTLSPAELRLVRGKEVGIIFQDPMTSLDPSFTVGYQLTSVMRLHSTQRRRAARGRALDLLGLVRIGDPRRRLDQYPHELSGGMRQRVMIAMAISCEPRVLIADEPTTALDATTQAQILELIRELSETLSMSTVITTHDLGVVAEVCDRVSVMYAGQVVEHVDTDALFHAPRHPYTERLLLSLPQVGVPVHLQGIPGAPPRPGHFPSGCRFAPRCSHAVEPTCTAAVPPLVGHGDREVRCAREAELHLSGVGT